MQNNNDVTHSMNQKLLERRLAFNQKLLHTNGFVTHSTTHWWQKNCARDASEALLGLFFLASCLGLTINQSATHRWENWWFIRTHLQNLDFSCFRRENSKYLVKSSMVESDNQIFSICQFWSILSNFFYKIGNFCQFCQYLSISRFFINFGQYRNYNPVKFDQLRYFLK